MPSPGCCSQAGWGRDKGISAEGHGRAVTSQWSSRSCWCQRVFAEASCRHRCCQEWVRWQLETAQGWGQVTAQGVSWLSGQKTSGPGAGKCHTRRAVSPPCPVCSDQGPAPYLNHPAAPGLGCCYQKQPPPASPVLGRTAQPILRENGSPTPWPEPPQPCSRACCWSPRLGRAPGGLGTNFSLSANTSCC